MIKEAYAAQLAVGAGLVTTPYWVSALQEVNLVLGFIAAVIGIIVGGHAIYRMLKGKQ